MLGNIKHLIFSIFPKKYEAILIKTSTWNVVEKVWNYVLESISGLFLHFIQSQVVCSEPRNTVSAHSNRK